MSITKEQWQKIANNLSRLDANVKFVLNGYHLHIRRIQQKPGNFPLVVIVNNECQQYWGVPEELRGSEQKGNEAAFISITKLVWRQKNKSVYTAKEIENIKKVWGKKEAKQEADKKVTWHVPVFNTVNSLVNQYKKLDGLKLISIGGVSYE